MGLFQRFAEAGSNKGANKSAPEVNLDEFITFTSADNRPVKMTRKEYRDQIILPAIKTYWNDLEALTDTILCAVDQKIYQDMLPHVKRVVELEKSTGSQINSVFAYSAIWVETGELDKAEKIIQDFRKREGVEFHLETRLGKIYYLRKDYGSAVVVLRNILKQYPNYSPALDLYLSAKREKEGEASYVPALLEVSQHPNSWYAHLLLMFYFLAQKDSGKVKTHYDVVQDKAREDGSLLIEITEKFIIHQAYSEIVDWILPIYGVIRHSPLVGGMILEACIRTGRCEEGRKLLSQMKMLDHPGVKQMVEDYERKLNDVENNPEALKQEAPAQKISNARPLIFRHPLWYYGMVSPEWALLDVASIQPFSLGLGLWSIERNKSFQAASLNFAGPRSASLYWHQGIPMYLWEILYFQARIQANLIFPVIQGAGTEISDQDYLTPNWVEQHRREGISFHYYLSGKIRELENGFELSMKLLKMPDFECVKEFSEKLENGNDISTVLGFLKKQLLEYLEKEHHLEVRPFSFYEKLKGEDLYGYLVTLCQMMGMFLMQRGVIEPKTSQEVLNLIQMPMKLARIIPDEDIPLLMILGQLGCALALSMTPELKIVQTQVFELWEKRSKQSPMIASTVPHLYRVYGMQDEFNRFCKKAPDQPAYLQWLHQLNSLFQEEKAA